jgi:hypothetical protein
MGIPIGSEVHKQLFCRMLLDTHASYKAAEIAWPVLPQDALARLRCLPFWDQAVETEGQAAARITALAEVEHDPLLREAIALQAFEELRHQRVLETMLRHYDIPWHTEPATYVIADPEWEFLRMGYGECFDSFFAFGLFHFASASGFFPTELVRVFEPIMQEEARHIVFFVNWAAYSQAQRAWWRRPPFAVRRLAALVVQAQTRLQMGRNAGSQNFTYASQDTLSEALTPRVFLTTCLAENDRRLGIYDWQLLRPKIVPSLVRLAVSMWPRQ